MAKIDIKQLTYFYDDFYHPVFDNVSFCLDTDWKLALIGRNGRGKTTFLKLLQGSLEPSGGEIKRSGSVSYFPYTYDNNTFSKTIDVLKECIGGLKSLEILIEKYSKEEANGDNGQLIDALDLYSSLDGFEIESRIYKEMAQMRLSADLLERNFSTLSGGEKTCILILALFLRKDSFVLLDEPTNHLDIQKKEYLKNYLLRKKGYIIVSHDTDFLDEVVDHVIAINKYGISIEQGNYSTWRKNVEANELFELRTEARLRREIGQLERKSQLCRSWSGVGNKQKYEFVCHARSNGARSYMRQAKRAEKHIKDNIEEKKLLLRNMEEIRELNIYQDTKEDDCLLVVKNLSFAYEGEKNILENISFRVKSGDKIWIRGRNGVGKTTLLNILSGKYMCDNFFCPDNLSIAYVLQEPYWKSGNIKELLRKEIVNQKDFEDIYARFLDMCYQFDLPEDFNKRPIETLSSGELKKVDIARSLSINQQVIIWDEPLNYMDAFFRSQLERALSDRDITLIFVEHNEDFARQVANKIVQL